MFWQQAVARMTEIKDLCTIQDLVQFLDVVSGSAALTKPPTPLFRICVREITDDLDRLSSNDVYSCCAAYARLNYRSEKLNIGLERQGGQLLRYWSGALLEGPGDRAKVGAASGLDSTTTPTRGRKRGRAKAVGKNVDHAVEGSTETAPAEDDDEEVSQQYPADGVRDMLRAEEMAAKWRKRQAQKRVQETLSAHAKQALEKPEFNSGQLVRMVGHFRKLGHKPRGGFERAMAEYVLFHLEHLTLDDVLVLWEGGYLLQGTPALSAKKGSIEQKVSSEEDGAHSSVESEASYGVTRTAAQRPSTTRPVVPAILEQGSRSSSGHVLRDHVAAHVPKGAFILQHKADTLVAACDSLLADVVSHPENVRLQTLAKVFQYFSGGEIFGHRLKFSTQNLLEAVAKHLANKGSVPMPLSVFSYSGVCRSVGGGGGLHEQLQTFADMAVFRAEFNGTHLGRIRDRDGMDGDGGWGQDGRGVEDGGGKKDEQDWVLTDLGELDAEQANASFSSQAASQELVMEAPSRVAYRAYVAEHLGVILRSMLVLWHEERRRGMETPDDHEGSSYMAEFLENIALSHLVPVLRGMKPPALSVTAQIVASVVAGTEDSDISAQLWPALLAEVNKKFAQFSRAELREVRQSLGATAGVVEGKRGTFAATQFESLYRKFVEGVGSRRGMRDAFVVAAEESRGAAA